MSSCRPTPNWNAALSGFTRGNMADAARRFELVGRRGRPTGPRRGRCRPVRSGRRAPTCWPAIRRNSRPISSARRLHGRTFYGLIAQKALGMRIEPDWNVPGRL